MATVQRYVNTASTAGGDGTTNGVAGATRAYATMSEWEANSGGSATDDYIVDCCGTAADGTQCLVDFTTNITTGSVLVRSNRSDGTGFYDGAAVHSTSHYRIDTGGSSYGLRANEKNTTFDGIQIKYSKTGSFNYALYSAAIFSVTKCRILAASNNVYAGIWGTAFKTGTYDISNNLVTGFKVVGIRVNSDGYQSPLVNLYHNTVWGDASSDGITCSGNSNSTATFTLKGNAIANSGSGADINVASIAAGDTVVYADNALDQYDLGTTDEIDLGVTTDAWTDPGIAADDDFTVKNTSSALYNAVNPTLVTTDITDFTRDGTNHDVGCFEFQVAGNTEGVGAAPAVGDAPAVGKATGRGVGAAPAVGNAPAVGVGKKLAVGAAPAVGDAPAVGKATGRGVGAAPAVGDAPAVGKSTARGVGTADAVGDAPAVAAVAGSVGAADAVGDAPAVGRSDARGVGTASATGDAPAIGSATARGVGSAAAVGDAPAVGKATGSAVGAAPAVGDAPAVGSTTARGVGAAPAVGDAPAVGTTVGGPTTGVGAAPAVGDAPAVGASTARAVGTADAIGDALGISPAAVAATLAAGVRRHGFLRRGPKLPWEEDDQEKADEPVVVSKPKRRRVKLPQVVQQEVEPIPVETSVTIDAPKIKIPGVGTATLSIPDRSDPEEESVVLALLH